jgi:YHS domain-containing protein/ATP-dependent Zn protease
VIRLFRKWWIYPIGIVLLLLIIFAVFSSDTSEQPDVSTSQFLADIQAGRVERIEVDGGDVEYTTDSGVSLTARLERGDSVRDILADAGYEPGSADYPTVIVNERGFGGLGSLAITFLPVIFIVGILFLLMRSSWQHMRRPPLAMFVLNYDPVCHMPVNPGSAAGSSTFMGTTYHFCSREHKDQFDADPTKYLLQK